MAPPKKSILQTVDSGTKQGSSAAAAWLWSLAGAKFKRAGIPEDAFKPRHRDNVFIGGMFIYQYDPKHKDTLPWYDTLPVVIPIEMYDDGWLGLNLHYLPPRLRAVLLDKLMDFHRRAHTRKAYMKVSYEFLKQVIKHDLFAPCVHRYLASHVRTRLIKIEDTHWEKVAMLPLQQFQKASATKVWGATVTTKRRNRK